MMQKVVKAIKVIPSKWNNRNEILNCVNFKHLEGKTIYNLTNTRVLVQGLVDLESPAGMDICIPAKVLAKVKKQDKIEFLSDGILLNGKLVKTESGVYPDVERVMSNPYDSKVTLRANFSELGTLLEALPHDVTIHTSEGKLEFTQKDSVGYGSSFHFYLDCEESLSHPLLYPGWLYTLLAKEKVESLDVMLSGCCDFFKAYFDFGFIYGIFYTKG